VATERRVTAAATVQTTQRLRNGPGVGGGFTVNAAESPILPVMLRARRPLAAKHGRQLLERGIYVNRLPATPVVPQGQAAHSAIQVSAGHTTEQQIDRAGRGRSRKWGRNWGVVVIITPCTVSPDRSGIRYSRKRPVQVVHAAPSPQSAPAPPESSTSARPNCPRSPAALRQPAW